MTATPSGGTFARQHRQPEDTTWLLGQAGNIWQLMVNIKEEPKVSLLDSAMKPTRYLWPVHTFNPRVEKKAWTSD